VGSRPRAATPAPSATSATAGVTAPRPTTFTTVEEDLARRHREHARSWTSIIAPLVTLAIALAAIAALGLYLSRPTTADELYATISRHTANDNVEAMRVVEREINDFIARFPDDPRTLELTGHQRRLELDKLHRQFQRHRGGLADPSLLPVEVLYLKAMNTTRWSPEEAIQTLESLIKLYGTSDRSSEADDRRVKCVELAERQLAQLRTDVTELTTRELASIRERLAAADKLAKAEPDQARRIYQAIVELYGAEPWATAAVAEAKQKLVAISTTPAP
jgi:hypothetical protein